MRNDVVKRDETGVTVYLTCRVYREDDLFVSECLTLPVTSQGETDAQALGNLVEAVQLFIISCVERNTLEGVLMKYHWRPMLSPPTEVSAGETVFPVPLSLVVKRRLDECRT